MTPTPLNLQQAALRQRAGKSDQNTAHHALPTPDTGIPSRSRGHFGLRGSVSSQGSAPGTGSGGKSDPAVSGALPTPVSPFAQMRPGRRASTWGSRQGSGAETAEEGGERDGLLPTPASSRAASLSEASRQQEAPRQQEASRKREASSYQKGLDRNQNLYGILQHQPGFQQEQQQRQAESQATNFPPTSAPTATAETTELSTGGANDNNNGQAWVPTIEIGAPLGANISSAEYARREVLQWEAIHNHTLETQPQAVGPILEKLEAVRRVRDELLRSDNIKSAEQELEEFKVNQVIRRVADLRNAAAECRHPDEAANIGAAVRGYECGLITYSDHFQLIYGGHLVDRCPTYESFSTNRQELLDRYHAQYGPGWLWFEPPLACDRWEKEHNGAGGGNGLAYMGIKSRAGLGVYGLGCHYISMAFKRDKLRVFRGDGSESDATQMMARQDHSVDNVKGDQAGKRKRVAEEESNDSRKDGETGGSDGENVVAVPPPRSPRSPPSAFPAVPKQHASGSSRSRSRSASPDTDKQLRRSKRLKTAAGSGSSPPVSPLTSPETDVRPGKKIAPALTSVAKGAAAYAKINGHVDVPSPSTAVMPRLARAQARARDANSDNVLQEDRDSTAPNLVFRMLLDSGATFSILNGEDFELLGINREQYPAQSTTTISTANGRIQRPLYELRTEIVSSTGLQLVDPNDPVWPGERPYIGGSAPVVMFGAESESKCERLSGMIPFKTCYISSAPGMETLWLGEDRADVLGAQRMPGQLRYEMPAPPLVTGAPPQAELRLADQYDGRGSAASFRHPLAAPGRGFLVDVDAHDRRGASTVRVLEQGRPERTYSVEPRRLPGQGEWYYDRLWREKCEQRESEERAKKEEAKRKKRTKEECGGWQPTGPPGQTRRMLPVPRAAAGQREW